MQNAFSVGELLWEPRRVAEAIGSGIIYQNLGEQQRKELDEIPKAEFLDKVIGALMDPKPLDICMPVLNAVLAAQYCEVFRAMNLPTKLSVYEPCVGGSTPVIIAAEAHSEGRANYLTINLNKKLLEELKTKIGHLRMAVRIIEDNAQRALEHLQPDSIDVACFHHAVNDLLQTAVSEPRGMDTTAVDWFPNERKMIEWLAEDVAEGRLEQRGKPELMQVIRDAVGFVRPGGYLIFDHFNWRRFIGVDWFPWDLFYNLIPMTRRWIAESGLPVTEVEMPGVDRQWWMVLRVSE
ncbi:MAG: hypothetical protein AUJ92_08065 [Armatimonadetes bacterium CG2_30_59_28]|nr:hypothetical protein [Armatimonadota bacterium]OIO95374.1 MAG: hypothetical protein AUJ92_08065 [Armatimonadetes bacterium CG2_30_59_28]PIU65829.1 MAG: hypothetical protein COS85_07280 [Armatimonadetes bacterium CG07_land_8_20_14_0_80_59_28]